MSGIRFSISLDRDLVTRFDEYLKTKGYQNRSEAIRDLIRKTFVREEWGKRKK